MSLIDRRMRKNPGGFPPEPRERARHGREHLKIIVSKDMLIRTVCDDGGDVIDTSTLLVRGLYLLNCKRGVLPVPDRTTRKNQEGLRLKAKDRSYSSRQAERFECMRNSPNYLVALSYAAPRCLAKGALLFPVFS